MKKDITLRPEMGTEIIRHLSMFGTLPMRGYLAGQAVDSAITDLWLGGGGVYNDLDIFRRVTHGVPRDKQMENTTAHRFEVDLVSGNGHHGSPLNEDDRLDDPYGRMRTILHQAESYEICSVNRQGLLNYVNFAMPLRARLKGVTGHTVINGFDLNCVRVGVDLSTGLLFWDRHYAEFLRTRQLQIVMMHTPGHTISRLCKKLAELPDVYAAFETEAIACAAITNSVSVNNMVRNKDVVMRFGKKTKEQALAFGSDAFKYFDLIDCSVVKSDKTVSLWTLGTKGSVDSALQKKVDRLSFAGACFSAPVVREHLRAKKASVNLKLQSVMSHRVAVQKSEKEKYSSKTEYIEIQGLLFGTAFVEGQALASVSDKVNEFFNAHRGFVSKLLGRPLAKQAELIRQITAIAAEYGKKHYDGDPNAVLAILEQQLSPAALDDEAAIRQLLDTAIAKEQEAFSIEPLRIPARLGASRGATVRQLNKAIELRVEGKEMKHCVGGYSFRVRKGTTRILSIRFGSDKSKWSTVELGLCSALGETPVKWEVVQHRSVSNQEPAQCNQEVLKEVMWCLRHPRLYALGISEAQALFAERLVKSLLLQAAKPATRLLARWSTASQANQKRLERRLAELGGPLLESKPENNGSARRATT